MSKIVKKGTAAANGIVKKELASFFVFVIPLFSFALLFLPFQIQGMQKEEANGKPHHSKSARFSVLFSLHASIPSVFRAIAAMISFQIYPGEHFAKVP